MQHTTSSHNLFRASRARVRRVPRAALVILGASVAAATLFGTTKLVGACVADASGGGCHYPSPTGTVPAPATVTAPDDSPDVVYGNQDPTTSTYTRANGTVAPCASGGKTVGPRSNISDKSGNVFGWVQLMWSPDCHTNWGLVSVAKSLPPQHIQVEAMRSDGYYTSLDLIPGKWNGGWSNMVYSPNKLAGAYAAFLADGNPNSAVVASGQAAQPGCKCPPVLSNGPQKPAPQQPLALPDGAVRHTVAAQPQAFPPSVLSGRPTAK